MDIFYKSKMKNLEIWIITFVIAIFLLVGVFYYGILETVANAGAFIISLTIIILALILLIIFSQKEPGKNLTQKNKVETKEKKSTIKNSKKKTSKSKK